jgi:hypothetical protein
MMHGPLSNQMTEAQFDTERARLHERDPRHLDRRYLKVLGTGSKSTNQNSSWLGTGVGKPNQSLYSAIYPMIGL